MHLYNESLPIELRIALGAGILSIPVLIIGIYDIFGWMGLLLSPVLIVVLYGIGSLIDGFI